MNSDNNYEKYNSENSDKFSFKTMFISAFVIFALILCIWYYYVNEYRYSSERIADKLLKKYNKPVDKMQTLRASSGVVNATKTRASAVMTIQNKDIDASASSVEVFSLDIKDCSPADNTCISL
jgi:hypothetical protein